MLKSKANLDYKFEPVHPDWSGLRTQITIGLLSIFCLCLINFIPFSLGNSVSFTANSFIDFTLYFASCSLVALITLEIGKASGNRNGAGCALWSAMIFAISPWQSIVSLSNFRISRGISFLFILAILLGLRTKHKTGKILSFICFMVALFCSLNLETNHVTILNPLKPLLFAEYAVVALIVCMRIILGALAWRVAFTFTLCIINAVICSEIMAYPSWIISTGASLAIALAVGALPVTDAASARTNRLYGWLGLLSLTSIAITYEFSFIGF